MILHCKRRVTTQTNVAFGFPTSIAFSLADGNLPRIKRFFYVHVQHSLEATATRCLCHVCKNKVPKLACFQYGHMPMCLGNKSYSKVYIRVGRYKANSRQLLALSIL